MKQNHSVSEPKHALDATELTEKIEEQDEDSEDDEEIGEVDKDFTIPNEPKLKKNHKEKEGQPKANEASWSHIRTLQGSHYVR